MAIRARSDNLSLDLPGKDGDAPVHDFAEVWAQREALRQACMRLIGDAARAEDLVQDTFVSALKCKGRLHEGQPVAPWLKTVARRRSIDELRGRDRVALMASPPEVAGPASDDPADYVVSQELVAQLRTAIAELSPRERQLLLRQASYGLSLAELAAEEATSVASVRSVLSRARQKLRGSLERGGVFGGAVTSLRDKLLRWGAQLEGSLPAMTGAGARVGEVVAAVVTAIAMLVAGGGAPSYPDQALSMIGMGTDGDGRIADPGAVRSGGFEPSGGGGGGSGPGGTTPTTTPASGPWPDLPPEISGQRMPDDATYQPEDMVVDNFAVSGDGRVVLAGGIGDGWPYDVLFRSDDGGASWRRVSEGTVGEMDRSRTFPGGSIFVSPSYPNDPTVIAVARNSVYRSTDGGRTFLPESPAVGRVLAAPDFGRGDDRLFVGGPPPAVYETQARRLRPMSVPREMTSAAAIAIGPDFATNGELLIASRVPTSTGMSTFVYSCTTAGCARRGGFGNTTLPDMLTSSIDRHKVIASSNAYLAYSSDAGATWTTVPPYTGFTTDGVYEAGGVFYHFGANITGKAAPLYRSTDGGATWEPLAKNDPFVKMGLRSLTRIGNGRLLAGSVEGGIFCSDDGGLSWATRCPPI